MVLEDFLIGVKFFIGESEWVCVDIGRKYIYAVKALDHEAILNDEDEILHIVPLDSQDMAMCSSEPFIVSPYPY